MQEKETKRIVEKVMAIWYGFIRKHGGHKNLNANILWEWPAYLKANLQKED